MPISLTPPPTPIVISSTAEFTAHANATHTSLFPGDGLTSYTASAIASLTNAIGYNQPATLKTALERLAATASDIAGRVVV